MALTFKQKRQRRLSIPKLLALAVVALVLLLGSNAFAADNVSRLITKKECTILEADKIIEDSDAPLPKECITVAADRIIRGSNRAYAAKQIGRYQMSAFAGSPRVWVLDTATGQVRTCEPKWSGKKYVWEALPVCFPWSLDDREAFYK